MVKINVSIPEDFLTEIDRYKKIKNITRSQFIIDAAKNYFNTIESTLALERKKDVVSIWEISSMLSQKGLEKNIRYHGSIWPSVDWSRKPQKPAWKLLCIRQNNI